MFNGKAGYARRIFDYHIRVVPPKKKNGSLALVNLYQVRNGCSGLVAHSVRHKYVTVTRNTGRTADVYALLACACCIKHRDMPSYSLLSILSDYAEETLRGVMVPKRYEVRTITRGSKVLWGLFERARGKYGRERLLLVQNYASKNFLDIELESLYACVHVDALLGLLYAVINKAAPEHDDALCGVTSAATITGKTQVAIDYMESSGKPYKLMRLNAYGMEEAAVQKLLDAIEGRPVITAVQRPVSSTEPQKCVDEDVRSYQTMITAAEERRKRGSMCLFNDKSEPEVRPLSEQYCDSCGELCGWAPGGNDNHACKVCGRLNLRGAAAVARDAERRAKADAAAVIGESAPTKLPPIDATGLLPCVITRVPGAHYCFQITTHCEVPGGTHTEKKDFLAVLPEQDWAAEHISVGAWFDQDGMPIHLPEVTHAETVRHLQKYVREHSTNRPPNNVVTLDMPAPARTEYYDVCYEKGRRIVDKVGCGEVLHPITVESPAGHPYTCRVTYYASRCGGAVVRCLYRRAYKHEAGPTVVEFTDKHGEKVDMTDVSLDVLAAISEFYNDAVNPLAKLFE